MNGKGLRARRAAAVVALFLAFSFDSSARGQTKPPGAAPAQRPGGASIQRPNLAGRWTLNRSLSQMPSDVGFGLDVGEVGKDEGGGSRGAASGGVFFRESQDDARRRELLVEQVRDPSPYLAIAQTDTSVTLTDDTGRSLTFHPNGREEAHTLDQVPLATISRWFNGRLEIRYKVSQDRELRYSYGRNMNPPQLTVQVQFVERGARDIITRVYEPARGDPPPPRRPTPPPGQAGTPKPTPPGGLVDSGLLRQPPAGATPPAGAMPPSGGGASPAVPGSTGAPAVPRGPDPELRGLASVGIVVEDLGSQAATCGLKQPALEAAVAKSLADAGLKVPRTSDEDTYVYVQVITTSAPNLCVSRYDVALYTHSTTTLSYQAAPVLARVMLLQKGGLAGGAPAGHGDSVTRAVQEYAAEIAKRIRAANQ